MKKIGLFYSFNSNNTARIAEAIASHFSEGQIEKINAELVTEKEFLSFENYILGVPTWFDGELPTYWDEFGPAIESMDIHAKSFALFGLGDQKGYPENFVDALGIMANLLESRGARLVGYTSVEGYNFEHSKAIRDNHFLGLAIDIKNQPTITEKWIENWVGQLKKEFV
jgi:flavodoxin I